MIPVGELLREWRAARRLSQLDLAMETGMSTRHLSCIETGKAQPSRDMALCIRWRNCDAVLKVSEMTS